MSGQFLSSPGVATDSDSLMSLVTCALLLLERGLGGLSAIDQAVQAARRHPLWTSELSATAVNLLLLNLYNPAQLHHCTILQTFASDIKAEGAVSELLAIDDAFLKAHGFTMQGFRRFRRRRAGRIPASPPSTNRCLINSLPQEIFHMILAYLSESTGTHPTPSPPPPFTADKFSIQQDILALSVTCRSICSQISGAPAQVWASLLRRLFFCERANPRAQLLNRAKSINRSASPVVWKRLSLSPSRGHGLSSGSGSFVFTEAETGAISSFSVGASTGDMVLNWRIPEDGTNWWISRALLLDRERAAYICFSQAKTAIRVCNAVTGDKFETSVQQTPFQTELTVLSSTALICPPGQLFSIENSSLRKTVDLLLPENFVSRNSTVVQRPDYVVPSRLRFVPFPERSESLILGTACDNYWMYDTRARVVPLWVTGDTSAVDPLGGDPTRTTLPAFVGPQSVCCRDYNDFRSGPRSLTLPPPPLVLECD